VPELIEVELYRRAAEQLVGDTVREVVEIDPRYSRGLAVSDVVEVLTGATVEHVRRTGKLLLVDTDRAVVGLRFGMTGRLLVDGVGPIDRLEYGASRDDRRWDRFVVVFESGRDLTINDPRRFGAIEIDPDESALGADAASITVGGLRHALEGRTGPLKARLLDQHRVAGLGNLLVDETLWRVGLSPSREAGHLDPDELRLLARTIRSTVRDLARRGGSHTGDLQAARLDGASCPRDGAILRRESIGGRTTYWCPEHQK
jgi:formamidopyrimidine-DNA glycosylase